MKTGSQTRKYPAAIHNLRELTPRSQDYIITFGERLNSLVVSAAFRQRGIPSCVLDGCEAGILTTAHHGEAMALPESEEKIRSSVAPLLSGTVPVIMGFMGCTEKGLITTLGRSGSDYSAAIIGAGIDADEIWIWTDVDGIMTSDPRLINDARVIPSISYLEVMELSFFGAKVMHPRSIEPAMKKDILVRVKNTFNPTTRDRHCRGEKHDSRVVKALTYIEKVAAININGAQMIGRPGVAKAIFTALAENEVNVMMISQGSAKQISRLSSTRASLRCDGIPCSTREAWTCPRGHLQPGCLCRGRRRVGYGRGERDRREDLHGSRERGGECDDDLPGVLRGEYFLCCEAGGRTEAVRILHDEFRLSEEDYA